MSSQPAESLCRQHRTPVFGLYGVLQAGTSLGAGAERMLREFADRHGHRCELSHHPIGGARDECGDPLSTATVQDCRETDALLLGAVGGPKSNDSTGPTLPEAGLLWIRKELRLFVNLRPIEPHPALLESSPLKCHIRASHR